MTDTRETLDRTTAPDVHPLKEVSYPEPDRRTLPNGLEMVILRQGAQPVNRITLEWNAGSADVPDNHSLAVMMPMLGEGTARHTGAEIAELLEYNGAWKGVEINRHAVALSVYMLNNTVNEIFPLVKEIVTEATFPTEAFEAMRERQAAQYAIRQQKADTMAKEESMRMLYGATSPFARTISPDRLRTLEAEDVEAVYRQLITGSRPRIYLCGDITPDIEAKATELFGNIPYPENQLSATFHKAPDHKESQTQLVEKDDSLQTAIQFAIPIPGMMHDHPDYEYLRIAVKALGGYFGSRLMSNIREDKGYTYGIQAYMSANREGTFMQIATQTDNRYRDAVVEEIEKEINRLATEEMSEEELSVVKSNMISAIAALAETPFSLTDYYRQLDQIPLPSSHYQRQLSHINSATPTDLRRVASEYLLKAPRLLTLAGPKEFN